MTRSSQVDGDIAAMAEFLQLSCPQAGTPLATRAVKLTLRRTTCWLTL
jgi:hypothetical protein